MKVTPPNPGPVPIPHTRRSSLLATLAFSALGALGALTPSTAVGQVLYFDMNDDTAGFGWGVAAPVAPSAREWNTAAGDPVTAWSTSSAGTATTTNWATAGGGPTATADVVFHNDTSGADRTVNLNFGAATASLNLGSLTYTGTSGSPILTLNTTVTNGSQRLNFTNGEINVAGTRTLALQSTGSTSVFVTGSVTKTGTGRLNVVPQNAGLGLNAGQMAGQVVTYNVAEGVLGLGLASNNATDGILGTGATVNVHIASGATVEVGSHNVNLAFGYSRDFFGELDRISGAGQFNYVDRRNNAANTAQFTFNQSDNTNFSGNMNLNAYRGANFGDSNVEFSSLVVRKDGVGDLVLSGDIFWSTDADPVGSPVAGQNNRPNMERPVWEVNGGRLIIDPTAVTSGIGGITVNNGGTLGGGATNHSIVTNNGDVVVLGGGSLSPGGAVTGDGFVNAPTDLTFVSGTYSDTIADMQFTLGTGTFDISGAVDDPNTGALIFQLGSVGNSDRITLLSGTLDIGSGVLEFDDFAFTSISGFGLGTYTLFDTPNAITGTLGSSLTGTIDGFTATLAFGNGGTALQLNVIPEPSTGLLILIAVGAFTLVRRRTRLHA